MNFRSLQKLTFISAGFLAGVIWIAACGGGSASIAETIATALEVSYDNATSGLTATTVQAALDELKVAVDAVPAAYTDADAQAALADQDVTLGAVTADSFTFGAVQTGYLSVPGIAFIPDSVNDGGAPIDYSTNNGARVGDVNASLTNFSAPVYLPNGATITTLSATFTDGGAGESISLMRHNSATNALSAHASVDSDTPEADGIGQPVDNVTYDYFLKAILPDSNFAIRRVLITYTYTTPTF